MNEQEWLACADRTLLLSHLDGHVTERQLRLFAVACCRHVWDLLPDQRSRTAVEVAEGYADRLVDARQQAGVLGQALAAANRTTGRAAWAPYWAAKRKITESVWNACEAALDGSVRQAVSRARATGADLASAWEEARSAGAREQARLLRDILGNPFRPAKLDAAWLHWQGGLVPALARRIYDERDFTGLAILADALEDAGCDDADVLSHCRSGGDHVRGCHVVDLLLGRR
jgi:hypothetical protein